MALAPDLLQEAAHVRGAVALVLGEDLDQVLERLALQLLEALPSAERSALAVEIEHLAEAHGGVGLAPELPQAPRALEQGQVVELALGILQHLVVLHERVREVVVGVEDVLGQRHVRVRAKAAVWEVAQDALEQREGLVFVAPFNEREGLHVQHQIRAREVRVLVEDAVVERYRAHVAGPWRLGAAVFLGDLLPGLERGQILDAAQLPGELRQAKQGVGHLRRALGLRADEGFEQPHGLGAARLDLSFAVFEQLLEQLGFALFGDAEQGVGSLAEVMARLQVVRGLRRSPAGAGVDSLEVFLVDTARDAPLGRRRRETALGLVRARACLRQVRDQQERAGERSERAPHGSCSG